MNLENIIQRVSLKLGEQTLFYSPEEIVSNGINPAQRLLCLAYPTLLQKRIAIPVAPDQVFIDLRQITPSMRRVQRVVLGDVAGDGSIPIAGTGELQRLLPTTLIRLAGFNDWMRRTGRTGRHRHDLQMSQPTPAFPSVAGASTGT